MIGTLPKTLTVNGIEYSIRTNFKDILKIIAAFNDPELEDKEKIYICLLIIYKDFDSLPQKDYEEAFKAALDFMDCGMKNDGHKSPRIMDWEQDGKILFPAINKVAGRETRSIKYLHWWTFIGFYMEISEGVFSHVISMRLKKAKGKPLDKWERQYWNENKSLCVLKPKLTAEEQEERDRLNALLS